MLSALLLVLVLGLPPWCAAIDGQSYKASDEEADRVWNDPNCERTRGTTGSVDWAALREQLLKQPFPHVSTVVQRLQRTSELEREASLCPFGVIAVLFLFTEALLEVGTLPAAISYHSLLDAFASGMHPRLIERADWLVTDALLIGLRRALLGRQQAKATPRRPRIYVYGDEVEEVRLLTQGASFCSKGQWGMEVHIHEWLLATGHLVRDAAEADFFLVPAYGICMFEGGFFSMPQLDELYTRLVQALPHFASRRREHIFIFGSGMSANVFRSWRREIPESIFLTPETWLFNDFPDVVEPCFDTWKDIAIPGYLHRHEILSLASQARAPKKRRHLAVFLGRADPSRGPHPATGGADVRGAIRRLEGRVFVGQNLTVPEMHAVMGDARFCFVPKGKSAWSLRLYEALFAGCVPVLLSDFWELPFEDFLNIPSFIIKWPMEHVGEELLSFLGGLPLGLVEAHMESGRQQRCWYVYPPLLHEVEVEPDALYELCPRLRSENAFVGIVRLLERKVRATSTVGRFFVPPDGAEPPLLQAQEVRSF